jgi:hypothetical protein
MKSMLATLLVGGMLLVSSAHAATPVHPGLGDGGTGLPPTASSHAPGTLPAPPASPATPALPALPEQATVPPKVTTHPGATDDTAAPPPTSSSTHGTPAVLPQPRCARGAHARHVTYLLRGTLSAFTAATAT